MDETLIAAGTTYHKFSGLKHTDLFSRASALQARSRKVVSPGQKPGCWQGQDQRGRLFCCLSQLPELHSPACGILLPLQNYQQHLASAARGLVVSLGKSIYPEKNHNWLIHVNVWQKPLLYCKVISLQLIKNKWGKKRYMYPQCSTVHNSQDMEAT